MMKEAEFILKVARILNHVAQTIEDLDIENNIDVDINGDILNLITLEGTYVVNKQTPLREIWLSSPITGPYHFAYNGQSWVSKSGDKLFKILSRDLKIKIQEI